MIMKREITSMFTPALMAGVLSVACVGGLMAATGQPHTEAADLTPVTLHPAPKHAPVEIVTDGQARAVIYVAAKERSEELESLLAELVDAIRESTGAELKIVEEMPSPQTPAIIVGASQESASSVDAATIPIEGFRILTGPNRVFLVGSEKALPWPKQGIADKHYHYDNNGLAWAVSDFLERLVGVRMYWPAEAWGRSVKKSASLTIPATNYEDKPIFSYRTHHPTEKYKAPFKARWFDGGSVPVEFQDTIKLKRLETPDVPFPTLPIPQGMDNLPMKGLLAFLKCGTSYPYRLQVHEPQGFHRDPKWLNEHPEIFALKEDGSRNPRMLSYTSDATLEFLLDGCKRVWDEGGTASWVTANSVTLSPPDAAVACASPEFQKLKDTGYGRAAMWVMANFLKKFATAVHERWPDKKVFYLPYWNYTAFPEGYEFPDNLEIMVANNFPPGLAEFREQAPRARGEKLLRDWSRVTADGKITTWEYSLSITGWVHAPVQFPNVVQNFYRNNRDVLAGSFVNGGNVSEWSNAAPTMYCWMKILWNPELNINATLEEMCKRMFGEAAEPAHELLKLMIDRYENATWSGFVGSGGRVNPKIYQATWPPEVVEQMQTLREKAESLLPKDSVERKRLDYWLWNFDAFREEAQLTTKK